MSNSKKSKNSSIYVGNGILDQINNCYYYTQEDFEKALEIAKKLLTYLEQYHNGDITMTELTNLCKTSLQLK